MEAELSQEKPVLSPIEQFIKRHEESLLRYIKYVQEYSPTANRKISPEILHKEIIAAFKADSEGYVRAHKNKIPYLESMLDSEEEIKESEEERWMNNHISRVFRKYGIKFLDINALEQLVETVNARAEMKEEPEVRTPFNGDVEMRVELTPEIVALRKLAEKKPYILNLVTRPVIRRAIGLYIIQGKSLGELVVEMKLSPNTIKGYIATALTSIKGILAQGAIMPAPPQEAVVQTETITDTHVPTPEATPLLEDDEEDQFIPLPELSGLDMASYMKAIKKLRNAGIRIRIVNNGAIRTDYIAAGHIESAKAILNL